VQQALVDFHGSQCGYCTPGFVMSMFALAQSSGQPSREDIDRALAGNLCRCTGYRPIVEAAAAACAQGGGGGDLPAAGKWPPPESLDISTSRQRYFRPVSLPEAVSLRHRYPEALIVAGATDVALRVTKGHELRPAC
jgi:xanthine dehydrogenase small subunit